MYLQNIKSVKEDHEHTRREAYNPPCADVLVNENVNVLYSREECLSNSNKKQQLIKLLAKHFRVQAYFTMYSEILICKSLCIDRTWKISLCLHSAIPTAGMVKYKSSIVIFNLCFTKLALALVLSFQEGGKTIL